MPDARYFDILEHSSVRFGYRIAVLSNWYRGPGYKFIENKYGLTEPECSALFCIGHGQGLTATDVCRITGRPKNSMSRAIHLLKEKDLLLRKLDPNDGRRRILQLTSDGRALFVKTIPVFLKTENEILKPLTPRELSNLDRLLTKMIANVTKAPKAY